MTGLSKSWAALAISGRVIGETTNCAPAWIASWHVFVSRTVPTPSSARAGSFFEASRMASMALGVVMVISMARIPPRKRASESGMTCSADRARTTATRPGLIRREMISCLVGMLKACDLHREGASAQEIHSLALGDGRKFDEAPGRVFISQGDAVLLNQFT